MYLAPQHIPCAYLSRLGNIVVLCIKHIALHCIVLYYFYNLEHKSDKSQQGGSLTDSLYTVSRSPVNEDKVCIPSVGVCQ